MRVAVGDGEVGDAGGVGEGCDACLWCRMLLAVSVMMAVVSEMALLCP